HAVLEEPMQVVEALLDRVSALDAWDAGDRARSARPCLQICIPRPMYGVPMPRDEHVELAQQIHRAPPRAARPLFDVLRIDPVHEDDRAEPACAAAHEVQVTSGPRS